MALTDVAFAAGFGSVRQFNDTIREVFATSPTDLRTRACVASGRSAGQPVDRRTPAGVGVAAASDPATVRRRRRAAPSSASERCPASSRGTARRTVARCACPAATASCRCGSRPTTSPPTSGSRRGPTSARPCNESVGCSTSMPIPRPSTPRCRPSRSWRRWSPRRPGRRSPGSVDPFETSVRAVVGQQVSVAGARTVTSKLVACGRRPLSLDDPELTHVFPSAERCRRSRRTMPSRCRRRGATRCDGSRQRWPTARSSSTPASTPTSPARRCSSSRASGRGPPTTS